MFKLPRLDGCSFGGLLHLGGAFVTLRVFTLLQQCQWKKTSTVISCHILSSLRCLQKITLDSRTCLDASSEPIWKRQTAVILQSHMFFLQAHATDWLFAGKQTPRHTQETRGIHYMFGRDSSKTLTINTQNYLRPNLFLCLQLHLHSNSWLPNGIVQVCLQLPKQLERWRIFKKKDKTGNADWSALSLGSIQQLLIFSVDHGKPRFF